MLNESTSVVDGNFVENEQWIGGSAPMTLKKTQPVFEERSFPGLANERDEMVKGVSENRFAAQAVDGGCYDADGVDEANLDEFDRPAKGVADRDTLVRSLGKSGIRNALNSLRDQEGVDRGHIADIEELENVYDELNDLMRMIDNDEHGICFKNETLAQRLQNCLSVIEKCARY